MKSVLGGDKEIEALRKDVASFMSITESGAAIQSLNDSILAMKKIAERLKDADYSKMKPEVAAKTISYLAKMVDEVTRLMEFAKGGPDHRTDIGLGEFLRYLDAEQFSQLNEWVAAGKARVIEVEHRDGAGEGEVSA
jgi:hypothetical protein